MNDTNNNIALRLMANAIAPAAILDDIFSFLGRFVAYPSAAAHIAHTLWVAHAHFMTSWETTPRIAFLSPEPGSGKTRALEITELLVPRPVVAVNMSPAALFRMVGHEDGLPTILFDEIDTVFGPKAKENEELRGLLNAGYRRGAKTYRCVVAGKKVEVEEIEAFSAVALAGLNDLPDTILTRSVVVRMRRRAPDERVEPYRRRLHAHEGDILRERLAAWANVTDLTAAIPTMPDGIVDRQADVWEALLAVADAAGGHWPVRAREAAVLLVAAANESPPSLGVVLLSDLRNIFGNNDVLATESILQRLHAIVESPWGDIRGKELDDRGLARRLKPYGIGPKQIRIGTATPRGYARADFIDTWARYLPSSPAGSKTSTTAKTPGGSVLPVLDVLVPQGMRGAAADAFDPAKPVTAASSEAETFLCLLCGKSGVRKGEGCERSDCVQVKKTPLQWIATFENGPNPRDRLLGYRQDIVEAKTGTTNPKEIAECDGYLAALDAALARVKKPQAEGEDDFDPARINAILNRKPIADDELDDFLRGRP